LDPFIPLIPLATDIIHSELLFASTHALGNWNAERDLRDASGDLPAVQDVLGAGNILSIADPRKVVQEAEEKGSITLVKGTF